MKGVILAGGNGTRLFPCTKVTNKHLLPVYNQPMIYYPIKSLIAAGITEILIVSGRGHAGHFLELLGSGKDFGARFSYEVQEEAGGIAQALDLAKKFVGTDKFVVILGDNIISDSLKPALARFTQQAKGAKIFLKQVSNPQAYGVAEIEDEKILAIEEKPQNPKSNLAVIGVYMFDSEVFEVIRNIKPSARGELEITDVNNYYIQQGTMSYEVLRGWWGDCGESFESLLRAAQLVALTMQTK